MQAAYAVELEKVIQDKENVSRQIEETRKIIDKKRECIFQIASQSLELRESMSAMQAKSQVADARTTYALSLYGKISNITWDYSAPNGRLCGCKCRLYLYLRCVNLLINLCFRCRK